VQTHVKTVGGVTLTMCEEHDIELIVQSGPNTVIYGCKNCNLLFEEVMDEW
jgi:hypothetical protein